MSDLVGNLEDKLSHKIIINFFFTLQKKNSELCQKIHDERMICLAVKVQIGLIQHKQSEANAGQDKELIDFFAE